MRRREFIRLVGGAVTWPLAASAQQPAMPVVGYMSARSPEDTTQVLKAFYKGLGEDEFDTGQNVNVEYRWAHGDYGRLPELAAELVQKHVDRTGGDWRRRIRSRGKGGDHNYPGCLQYGQ